MQPETNEPSPAEILRRDCASADIVVRAINELEKTKQVYLVGIAGIPGSGKSTLCRELQLRYPAAVIVPMDGYHIPRCELDAEGMRRRGAPYTFNHQAFRNDIQQLRLTGAGSFPAFDHAEKDPRADAIQVTRDTPLVFVEGIYVLMSSWQVEPLFDLRVFVDCDLDTAVERVARRHVACGITATLEEGRRQANSNDRVNSQGILDDGCRTRADVLLPG